LNSGSGISTLEVLEASAPQYSGALRANQINFSFAGLTSNDFTQDVLLFSQGSNNRLTTGGGRVVAYLSDIPATVSSFVDLGTDTLRASTINMEGTGLILWDNGASIYEVGPNQLFLTTGGTTNIDLQATQIVFAEGGVGGQMRFFDNTLEVAAISTNNVSALGNIQTSTLNGGIPFTTANPPAVFNASTILVSSIGSIGNVSSLTIVPNNIASWNVDSVGRFTEVGTNFNLQAQSSSVLLAELLLDSASGGGNGLFRLAAGVGNINASTIAMSTNQLQVNTISTNTVGASNISFNTGTLSSLMFVSTAFIPGTGTSTTTYLNTDVSIGQNDFYCGQLRVGALSTAVQAEVIIYQPDGGTKALNVQDGDRTLRIGSSALGGVLSSPGYILDTFVNPPFFSTLAGTSTALMAFFPSTSASTIGVSTLSVVPPQPAASFLSRSTQTVAANTPLTLWHEVAGASVGSAITQSTNTLVIGQAGVYDIETSIQFDKSGPGVTAADFWFRKNGVDIPDSASQITIQGNTGECLGNVSIFETFAAGDKLEVVIASADNTLAATFFQSTVTTPYTRPAVPSIITNIKKLG
jgi:hypothetical protein